MIQLTLATVLITAVAATAAANSSSLATPSVGSLAHIKWGMATDYYDCIGRLKIVEEIPELEHSITALTDVYCPNGEAFDYIVGVRKSQLQKADQETYDDYRSRFRSRNRKQLPNRGSNLPSSI
jgi:hypothetical protein